MRDPMNGASISIYNNVDEEDMGHANGLSDLLNTTRNHILEHPNMGVVRKERLRRNKTAMQVISPSIANHVMGKNPLSKEESAAVCIQSHFRGYLGRKLYLELFYEQYQKEEAERQEKIREQVMEGQILVDNYHLKQEMEENDCLRRNKRRNEDCSAITIQRVWRQYSGKLHDKLVGSRASTENHPLKDAENGYCRFNSFALSPFEDDFYEEDLFHNGTEEPLEHYSDDEPENDVEPSNAVDRHSETASELSDRHLSRRSSGNSETADLGRELSPPLTDWESMDSQYSPDPKVINRLSAGPDYLQLCFGDDNALSDEEDSEEEDAQIKEYVIIDRDAKNEAQEKRDSGCILKGNELNFEGADVKIIKPEELARPVISHEETTQVLLELDLVNEPATEEHDRKMEVLRKKLERFSVRHLETQIRDLRLKVKEISDELVKELVVRDQLHTRQDALLMDVEDAVKYAQTKHKLSQQCKK